MQLLYRFLMVFITLLTVTGATTLAQNSIQSTTQIGVSGQDREEILKTFHSIFIVSRTSFASLQVIQKEVYKKKEMVEWGMVFVEQGDKADAVLTIDRPLALGFDYTFSLVDQKTGVVLCSGKTIAIDGIRASSAIADQIVKCMKSVRPLADKKSKKNTSAGSKSDKPTVKQRKDLDLTIDD